MARSGFTHCCSHLVIHYGCLAFIGCSVRFVSTRLAHLGLCYPRLPCQLSAHACALLSTVVQSLFATCPLMVYFAFVCSPVVQCLFMYVHMLLTICSRFFACVCIFRVDSMAGVGPLTCANDYATASPCPIHLPVAVANVVPSRLCALHPWMHVLSVVSAHRPARAFAASLGGTARRSVKVLGLRHGRRRSPPANCHAFSSSSLLVHPTLALHFWCHLRLNPLACIVTHIPTILGAESHHGEQPLLIRRRACPSA